MADNKKEQEREELHKAIWNIANGLRGSVDGWDFKQYVLGFMFYRYISENIANYINHDEHEAGNPDFDYAELSDEDAEEARADMVKTKGFFILPSQLFVNVRKRADKDENLNETLEKIFQAIENSAQGTESEDDFKGLFDDIDVNSNKLGATVLKRNEKLVKLLNGIGEMKLGDYSTKWAGDSNPLLINDPRFSPAGILAPKSYADMAFIMHSLSWLATNGTAAIVCFPGIFYRGGAEKKIRQYLVDNNFIDCIIQLPSNLFFGTSIAPCIMVLKKSKTDNALLFIDATNECEKVTNNNKLRQEDIDHILGWFTERKDVPYIARLVQNSEIGENDYNLSVSTYVEKEDKSERVDIAVLNQQIAEIVAREQVLREEIDKIIAEIEG